MLKIIKPTKTQFIYLLLVILTIIVLLILTMFFSIDKLNHTKGTSNSTFKVKTVLAIVLSYSLIICVIMMIIKVTNFFGIKSDIKYGFLKETKNFCWLEGIRITISLIYFLPFFLILMVISAPMTPYEYIINIQRKIAEKKNKKIKK